MSGTHAYLFCVLALVAGCGGGGSESSPDDAGAALPDGTVGPDGDTLEGSNGDSKPGSDGSTDATTDGATEGGDTCSGSAGDGGTACYSIQCTGGARTLEENRDRLVLDLAKRKCIDRCTLWAVLNQAERYIFLMDTAYLADPTSRLYPPAMNNPETALDHAVALYSINGPKAGQGVDGSGRGGNDYNRIYLGFDALGECVMRNFAIANPTHDPKGNQWQSSDDLAGPHAPFTQREMIFWYKAFFDLQSEGPQWHHWHQDSDFNQSGLNQRLGVCGVTDRSLTELTIAFDSVHNSDPLGDYSGRGGYGWQIVDQHDTIPSNWSYMPTGCPTTQPVNTDPYGAGTFAGMGPSLNNGSCTVAPVADGGC